MVKEKTENVQGMREGYFNYLAPKDGNEYDLKIHKTINDFFYGHAKSSSIFETSDLVNEFLKNPEEYGITNNDLLTRDIQNMVLRLAKVGIIESKGRKRKHAIYAIKYSDFDPDATYTHMLLDIIKKRGTSEIINESAINKRLIESNITALDAKPKMDEDVPEEVSHLFIGFNDCEIKTEIDSPKIKPVETKPATDYTHLRGRMVADFGNNELVRIGILKTENGGWRMEYIGSECAGREIFVGDMNRLDLRDSNIFDPVTNPIPISREEYSFFLYISGMLEKERANYRPKYLSAFKDKC